MNCKQTIKNIPHYLDEALHGSTRAEMDIHLSGCSSCTGHLARFSEIWNGIEHDIITSSDPFFFTRLSAKLQKQQDQVFLPSLRLRPVTLILTVILPLLIGAWLGISFNYNDVDTDNRIETITEINNLLSTPGYTNTDILLFADAQSITNGNYSNDQ